MSEGRDLTQLSSEKDFDCFSAQEVTLYQVGDLAEEDETSFNNFLDAIDASYVSNPRPDSTRSIQFLSSCFFPYWSTAFGVNLFDEQVITNRPEC